MRLEDVTIGFGVSLAVGALFWPRGAAALMRRNLAASYARGAEYVAAAVHQLIHGGDSTRARRQARAAADRLDDAFRQYLGELSGDRKRLEGLAILLAGATRLRLAADSLWSLADVAPGRVGDADGLDVEVRRVRSWYTALGEALGDARLPPPPDDGDRGHHVDLPAALSLLWAAQHLDNLRELELQLVGPAGELAGAMPSGLRI